MTERNYVQLAADYQAGVLAGTIPACKWVQLACARNRKDLDRQDTADFPFRFDPHAGSRICQMAEMLPHVKGPLAFVTGQDDEGRNIWNTLVLEPWQCWLLTTLFGWLRADGRRRFRTALWLIPRKNSKSTLGAVIALYMLVADGESGAEVYSAATTRDQAKVVAEIAWEMASRSPAFREYFGVKIGSMTMRSIRVAATGSKFAPLSADANSLDGLNISCAIVDELHAHKTRGVWDVLDTATGARLQPLIAAITTAGVEIGGICHEKLQYLERLLDGTATDETFFGVNYTSDADDDWRLAETHRKANPNYGVSVQPDDLVRKVTAAEQSPAAINNFLTKHLNVWVRTEAAWMTATDWQRCTVAGLTLEQLREYPCWIGVDLGEVRDTTAICFVFKLGDDKYAVIPRIFLPEEAISQSPIAQIGGWVRTGDLVQTPGNEADYARVIADLLAAVKLLKVQEIDFDMHSARLMMQTIKDTLEPSMGRDRVDQFVIAVKQGIETMDPAMKTTERLVSGTRLQHDGNPVMAWMIANVVIERNYKDEIYPRKAGGKDSPNKIDGPVAFWTALSRAMIGPEPEKQYQIIVAGGRKS
jgi:phage terminase large subunit-like protein